MTNAAVTDVQWSPNYSSGRPYGDVDSITIHHWGVDGQSHQNVVNYLCRDDGNSSAHYVASAGRVTQLVHDYDRAWHAGPGGNPPLHRDRVPPRDVIRGRADRDRPHPRHPR